MEKLNSENDIIKEESEEKIADDKKKQVSLKNKKEILISVASKDRAEAAKSYIESKNININF